MRGEIWGLNTEISNNVFGGVRNANLAPLGYLFSEFSWNLLIIDEGSILSQKGSILFPNYPLEQTAGSHTPTREELEVALEELFAGSRKTRRADIVGGGSPSFAAPGVHRVDFVLRKAPN